MSPIVRPIHARDTDVVEIHWHTAREIFVERRSVPPKATREAKAAEPEIVEKELDERFD